MDVVGLKTKVHSNRLTKENNLSSLHLVGIINMPDMVAELDRQAAERAAAPGPATGIAAPIAGPPGIDHRAPSPMGLPQTYGSQQGAANKQVAEDSSSEEDQRNASPSLKRGRGLDGEIPKRPTRSASVRVSEGSAPQSSGSQGSVTMDQMVGMMNLLQQQMKKEMHQGLQQGFEQ